MSQWPCGLSLRSGNLWCSSKTAPKRSKKWYESLISSLVAGFSCPENLPSGLVEVGKPFRAPVGFQIFQEFKILQVPEFFYVFLSLRPRGIWGYPMHQGESLGVLWHFLGGQLGHNPSPRPINKVFLKIFASNQSGSPATNKLLMGKLLSECLFNFQA